MRKKIMGCIVVLILGALVSSGCAKKDMVKAEEPVAAVPTQSAPAPEAAKPAQPEEAKSEPMAAGKSEPMAETQAKETTVKPEAGKEATQGSQGTQLQSELQKIYFNFDSADLSEESRSILSKNADLLSKQSALKVRIEGNCDERGSDEYNMALGERRAKAAKDYLVSLGVQAERLSIISYGEEKPAVDGHDEAAWAKNRRDEFVIVK
jgi:peptidoglycan-associated lipoprotein